MDPVALALWGFGDAKNGWESVKSTYQLPLVDNGLIIRFNNAQWFTLESKDSVDQIEDLPSQILVLCTWMGWIRLEGKEDRQKSIRWELGESDVGML